MLISKDWKEFVESLNSAKSEYLVVGAFAVAFYGFIRNTGDLDLLVRPDPDNARRVLAALKAFGLGALDISEAELSRPDQIIQFGYPPNRIDLITSISGVTFDEAWLSREAGDLDGVPCFFIGRQALIRNKQASARPKDLVDAGELARRIIKE